MRISDWSSDVASSDLFMVLPLDGYHRRWADWRSGDGINEPIIECQATKTGVSAGEIFVCGAAVAKAQSAESRLGPARQVFAFAHRQPRTAAQLQGRTRSEETLAGQERGRTRRY